MFLFIGESLGLQELIFIGVIALIIFGPRRLPQMARTLGKMMSEFRRTTNEFKETWQREVDFEDFKDEGDIKTISPKVNSIAKNGDIIENQIAAPEIKEISAAEIEQKIPASEIEEKPEKSFEKIETGKRDWL